MSTSSSHRAQNRTTNKKVKGAPDYDDAAYWDTKFITGQDVGEWLNEGDSLIERAISELEIQYTPPLGNGSMMREAQTGSPRALHLGPGISAVGSKLCEAFERRGWKGCDIIVWLPKLFFIHDSCPEIPYVSLVLNTLSVKAIKANINFDRLTYVFRMWTFLLKQYD